MAPATTISDQSHVARKLLAGQLLRELAAMLLSQADSMDKAPLCSPDWPMLHLHSAQSACGLWQRRVTQYIRTWEIEDFESRQPEPPDL